MKNNFLEKGNWAPLEQHELLEIEGGKLVIPKWAKKLGWGGVILTLMDNWDVIKEAVVDGWNGEYGCDSCD